MLTLSNWSRRAARVLLAVGALSCMTFCLLGAPQAMAAGVKHGRQGHYAHHIARRKHPHHRSRPLGWRLSIPDIGVAAPVIRLGGPRNGKISVPSFAEVWDVGWYRYGVVPGDHGNALLLGHVDTYMGPAVFYDLYALRPGDTVKVSIGHGRTRTFKVHWVKEVPKNHFPASRILGGTRGRHLWLVTCGGQFDYVTRSYLSNIVVYTTLVQPHRHHRNHHSHVSHPHAPHPHAPLPHAPLPRAPHPRAPLPHAPLPHPHAPHPRAPLPRAPHPRAPHPR